jgi:hypothetical protein
MYLPYVVQHAPFCLNGLQLSTDRHRQRLHVPNQAE